MGYKIVGQTGVVIAEFLFKDERDLCFEKVYGGEKNNYRKGINEDE